MFSFTSDIISTLVNNITRTIVFATSCKKKKYTDCISNGARMENKTQISPIVVNHTQNICAKERKEKI